MTVFPFTYVLLCRARRNMSSALLAQDWVLIRGLDREMSDAVNAAYADKQIDSAVLLAEMDRITLLYKQVLKAA